MGFHQTLAGNKALKLPWILGRIFLIAIATALYAAILLTDFGYGAVSRRLVWENKDRNAEYAAGVREFYRAIKGDRSSIVGCATGLYILSVVSELLRAREKRQDKPKV
jgi:hypothetical protein